MSCMFTHKKKVSTTFLYFFWEFFFDKQYDGESIEKCSTIEEGKERKEMKREIKIEEKRARWSNNKDDNEDTGNFSAASCFSLSLSSSDRSFFCFFFSSQYYKISRKKEEERRQKRSDRSLSVVVVQWRAYTINNLNNHEHTLLCIRTHSLCLCFFFVSFLLFVCFLSFRLFLTIYFLSNKNTMYDTLITTTTTI